MSTSQISYIPRQTPENYTLEEVAQKIEKLTNAYKKTCLFIGRQTHEPLPSEDNTVWISGDREFGRPPFSPDRLHICTDFTVAENLQRFHGLFNKIVIDESTTKCLGGDFIGRFVLLLKPLPDSQ